jgi:hypothetical protein
MCKRSERKDEEAFNGRWALGTKALHNMDLGPIMFNEIPSPLLKRKSHKLEPKRL